MDFGAFVPGKPFRFGLLAKSLLTKCRGAKFSKLKAARLFHITHLT
jgi:hypothetical protein